MKHEYILSYGVSLKFMSTMHHTTSSWSMSDNKEGYCPKIWNILPGELENKQEENNKFL